MHTGEYEFSLGDQTVTLVYDWTALSKAQAVHGKEVFQNLFASGPDVVADVLAIGLKKRNPEWTKAKIMELSPPLIPMIQAIDKALEFAYFGPKGRPEETGDDDGKKIE